MSDIKTILVYQKISEVTDKLAKEGIGKKQKNTHQNYNFRGIDDVYNSLAPALISSGLVVLPRITASEYEKLQNKSGGTTIRCVLNVAFDIVAHDGSTHIVNVIGEALDTSDKATNKAMAIAYKYMALMTFCIPIVGNDDPDSVTLELGAPHASQPKKQTQLDAKTFNELLADSQNATQDNVQDVKNKLGTFKAKMSPEQMQQIGAALKNNMQLIEV